MEHYYTRVNFLPTIPLHLIPDIDTITQSTNVCPTANITPNSGAVFEVYDASSEIYDLIMPCLETKANIRWQIITDDLPVHYDWGTSWEKYLYIIHKGGPDVVTRFWSEKPGDPVTGGSFTSTNRELMFEVTETEQSWFRLNVKTPHQVVNITSPRLALIIRPVK